MPFTHVEHPSGTTPPAPPLLPDGWRYTDDLPVEDPLERAHRRRLLLGVLIGVSAAVVIAGLLVVNAQIHYSHGVQALSQHAYAKAAAELSAANLVGLSYRDAPMLAQAAKRGVMAQADAEATAVTRVSSVNDALARAQTALEQGSAQRALKALQSVDAADLRAIVKQDADASAAATALAGGLTTAAGEALGTQAWGRAGRFAAALLVLDPSSDKAGALAARATQGQKLSARLAEAQDAARRGQWHKALSLALAVRAAQSGFPGASTLIAEAHKALKPKPAPKPATTSTASSASTGTGGGTSSGTSSGSSSGSSSQPPPP